jgi:hypothetical protein
VQILKESVFQRASKWTFSLYSCWAQMGLEATMALYEFRLLDTDGKVTATTERNCDRAYA